MIKFLPLAILGVSKSIKWKIKNAVYRFQISILVPEIFKLKKIDFQYKLAEISLS